MKALFEIRTVICFSGGSNLTNCQWNYSLIKLTWFFSIEQRVKLVFFSCLCFHFSFLFKLSIHVANNTGISTRWMALGPCRDEASNPACSSSALIEGMSLMTALKALNMLRCQWLPRQGWRAVHRIAAVYVKVYVTLRHY